MIRYSLPKWWVYYDVHQIVQPLVEARAVVLALHEVPYQRSWADALQAVQLKREVAGSSRIEGAQFTDAELDAAMLAKPEDLDARSQRQASAVKETYRWIATVPDDRQIDGDLILEVHRRIVTGADDDHCPPGRLRGRDQNVTFGAPPHRGAGGGPECEAAFAGLVQAIRGEFGRHDLLVQAMAAHYHLVAMHPFLDGNGRTARALEALFLRRAGLRDTCFIAMSNYYYENKPLYMGALGAVRVADHDLTTFLEFGLRGVASQARSLLTAIKHEISKALFRDLMTDLFGRLQTPKQRVIAGRQMAILGALLDVDWMTRDDLIRRVLPLYGGLKSGSKLFGRDLLNLLHLGAINMVGAPGRLERLAVRLEWPTEITETIFFERLRALPRAKTHPLHWYPTGADPPP